MPSQAIASRPFTRIAAGFFALLALGHILRLAFAVEVVIDGMAVPLALSGPVAVVAAALAVLVGRESRG